MAETVGDAIEAAEKGTPAEQRQAIAKLGEHGSKHPADLAPYLDVVCPFAADEEREVRWNVAMILMSVVNHDPGSVVPHADTVCTLLTDDDSSILALAAMTASAITYESPTALSDCVDRLLELVSYNPHWGADGDIRDGAIAAVGNIGEVDPAVAARADVPIAERLEDAKWNVRASAVTTVTKLGLDQPETIPTALARLPTRLDDDNPEIRRRAIMAYNVFRLNQPAAISQPKTVAPALRRAVERADLDPEIADGTAETCRYIEEMAAGEHG